MEKRLSRSRKNKIIAGVCGGCAEYFNIDPTIVRILWAAITLTYGVGVVAYIAAAIIMPKGSDDVNFAGDNSNPNQDEGEFDKGTEDWGNTVPADRDRNRNIIGILLIFFGIVFFMRQFLDWFDARVYIPLILIGVGVYIIYKGRRG